MSVFILNICNVGPIKPSLAGQSPSETVMAWEVYWGPAFLFNGTVTFELYNPSSILVQTWVVPVSTIDYGACGSYTGYPLTAGAWTVKATRSDTGEIATLAHTIAYPDPEYTIVTDVLTDTTCGLDNGSFRFYHHGAIGLATPYPYVVKDGGGNTVATGVVNGLSWSTVSGLSPGVYTITVNIAFSCNNCGGLGCPNCTADLNAFVDQTVTIGGSTSSISLDNTTVVDSSCQAQDGSIEITASSSCSPNNLSIAWTGPGGFTGSTFLIQNLVAGIYSYTITDCQCTLTGEVSVLDSGCCWVITSCTPIGGQIVTISLSDDLSSLNGLVIDGVQVPGFNIDEKICWLVGLGACTSPSFALTDFRTSFSTCQECQECNQPTEVVNDCEQAVSQPVKVFFQIKESDCDINVINKFAHGYWNKVTELRFGITTCYPADLVTLWLKKELSNLDLMTLPDYLCRNVQSTCPWIPKCGQVPNIPGGGTSVVGTAGEDLLFGKVVILGTNGKFYLNDPTDLTTYQRVVGLVTRDTPAGSQVRIIVSGQISGIVWTLTPGILYYASPGGNLVSTAPVSGISQVIGIAQNSSTLLVDIGQPVIL